MSAMPKRSIRQILSFYSAENPGTLTNLSRLLSHGRLGGTGYMVSLPVDQGFEHGPARSFAPNEPAYQPHYHFQLAIDSGCNFFAAPLGLLEAAAADFAGDIPLVLKLNSHDLLAPDVVDPCPAVTASVRDALRLGCVGIGYTIYPGSSHFKSMYEDLRDICLEAKAAGLVVVVWAYPRGSGINDQKGETAIDVVAYAVQLAAQMGATIIKAKLPTSHIDKEERRKIYEENRIPIATLVDRVTHVVQSAFAGRRIVIFSGGGKMEDSTFFEQCRAIRAGGGFGSIIGRNSFQRSRAEALVFLRKVIDIYSDDGTTPE